MAAAHCAYDGGVRVRELQEPALAELDAAYARAVDVVDPNLLALVTARIEHALADGPVPAATSDARQFDVAVVVEQMLVDVAGLDDATVQRTSAHFREGEFADLIMASYIVEARVRLRVAAERLWPAP